MGTVDANRRRHRSPLVTAGAPPSMPEYHILTPPPRRHRVGKTVALLLVVVALVAAGGYLVGRHAGGNGPGAAAKGSTSTTASSIHPLQVVSTTPATGATSVPSDQALTVVTSAPVAAGSAMPTLSPSVAGSWTGTGTTTLTFHAAAPLIPTTTYTLTVHGGEGGVMSTHGALLAAPTTVTFTVTQASTERLQQLLAQLNYLPLSFTPSAPLSSPAEAVTAQQGAFAWRWAAPAAFTSLWTEGEENPITKGAVMNFENQNGLTVDGLVGRRVWSALLADVAAHKANGVPYVWVYVDKDLPENLTLYDNGNAVFADVAVNTGAPGADTVDGTYQVFEHVTSSRMTGTNPDGSHYDDPAVPWASYFNGGDALHGFVRATYGSPQSNGCVEMPVAVAGQIWPLTPIGTVVTVAGPAS